jgi:RNA polymerase sigma-70 factor (ECF subfamily)
MGQQRAEPGRQHLIDLYASEFDGLYRFCLARCGDRSVAEDVAAETFFAAATHLAAQPDEALGRGWLYTVARRRLVDHWRRTARHRRRIERLLELGETQSNATDDPFDHEGDAVLAALRSLPPRQRVAISLRYLDDHSVAEIATVMEIDYRAAESLIARGRRSLITAWEER